MINDRSNFWHVILRYASASVLVLVCVSTPVVASPVVEGKNKQSIELNDRGVAAVKAKDFVGAEGLFKKALDLDPRNASAAFNLAGMYLQNKKPDNAIQLLKGYADRAPNDPGIFSRLGDAYFASKKLREAQLSYEKALQLDRTTFGVARKLSTIYVLQGRTQQAEVLLEEALKTSPDNHEIMSNLSSVYLANGKTEAAISVAKTALQKKSHTELYVTLGLAYEKLKDYPNSITAFEKAAVMDGKRKDVKEKIAELKKRSEQQKIKG